jgi:apolipoprotein N-acyltransferase
VRRLVVFKFNSPHLNPLPAQAGRGRKSTRVNLCRYYANSHHCITDMETQTADSKLPTNVQPLNWWKAALLVLVATGYFHAAYTPAHPGPLALLIIGYVMCLVQLAQLRTTRRAFYTGLLTGLLCFGPQLAFFWTIFGPAAIALWAVLAFWIALFVALTHVALVRFGARHTVWLVPFLWTGLEYFRSELYYLKFAWLNVGFAFGGFQLFGVYGMGFVAAGLGGVTFFWERGRTCLIRLIHVLLIVVIIAILLGLFLPALAKSKRQPPRVNLRMAGVQLEFPYQSQLQKALDKVIAKNEAKVVAALTENNAHTNRPVFYTEEFGDDWHTNLDLIVLPEYTLDGPPTEQLKNWCRENGKFLIVGGKDPAPGNNFYDSAFVISTNGEVVFKQAKSVPIQFFKDGLRAPEQKLWESPWGKIGICICYDLSYARVTDELVRQGAQLLIMPTMDVADWGRHQHELHARVAPVRAAEYGIPIFRVASSGISQGVNGSGWVEASASFPGEGEMIFFATRLGKPASMPLDRWLAPLCVGVTGLFVFWLAVGFVLGKRTGVRAE